MKPFQVTPQLLKAGIASMSRLPPSPDLKQLASPRSQPDPFALNESRSSEDNNKGHNKDMKIKPLDGVAPYTDFYPEALACSMPLIAGTYNADDDNNIDQQLPRGQRLPQPHARAPLGFTSLGAVAGPHGVALFRISKPHVPLLFLKHESQMNHANTGTGSVTSLVFQPETEKSLFLASARGSGILVWDVSGNSMNPLAARLGFDPAITGLHIANSRIASLAWLPNQPHVLAATTPTVACLWDLRSSNGSSSLSSSTTKPILRFGKSQRVVGSSRVSGPSLVHIACTDRDSCATMDAKGFVHLFDLRMTGKNQSAIVGAVSSFSAFQHAGVGLASFLTTENGNGWISWGLDHPNQTVVKVWSPDASLASTTDNEDYWYLDSSMDPSIRTSVHLSKSSVGGYRLAAQCTSQGMACARICPRPIDDRFVTVSACPVATEGGGWRAEVWKMSSTRPIDNNGQSTFGLDRVASMRGGGMGDTSLRNLLGKTSLGQICASELALLSSSTQSWRPSFGAESSRQGEAAEADTKLVLCCLTQNGFVTTQFVPDIMPKKSDGLGLSNGNESPMKSSRLGVRGFLGGNSTRIFNLDKDGFALNDAAGAWNAQSDQPTQLVDGRVHPSKDDQAVEHPPTSPNHLLDHDYEPFQSLSRQPDGGTTPFDMDNVLTAASGDLTVKVAGSTVTDEGATTSNDIRNISDRMEQIDKDRIPCPRLCGASFGSGVGGIAMFNNGEVKKMWSWYQQAFSRQKPYLPLESFEMQIPGFELGTSAQGQAFNFKVEVKSKAKDCPRSFQDLIDMTGAAKEAQWGDVVDSSRSCDDEGDDFFEEDSFDDGSNSSDSIQDDSTRQRISEPDSQDAKYEERRLMLSRKVDSPASPGRKARGPGASGPSSDMLAPLVSLKLALDGLLLNNQTPELATRMKLGDWGPSQNNNFAAIDEDFDGRTFPEWTVSQKQTSRQALPLGQELPHYRALFPGSSTKRLAKVKSDPMLDKMPEFLGVPFQGDEPGVHGGEYSVRPGRQESMVFLRKLFTHQQEGGVSYPSLISPPDGPMLPSSLSPMKRNRSLASLNFQYQSQPSDDRVRAKDNTENALLHGVYTLDGQQSSLRRQRCRSSLLYTRDLCVHNGSVCADVGQEDKASVWSLLAENVECLIETDADDFSGWGGFGGGALGTGLVANILKYYESLGDVQMLSTLVCVLGGGSRRSHGETGGPNPLIPADCNHKYDAYLRKYSDILYAWGLLNTRVEVNKHLTRDARTIDDEITFPSLGKNADCLPGLTVSMICPRCGTEPKSGNNFCNTCHDFVLRCSVCSDAVRGLFTMCESCGHGGHVGHLMDWFAKNSDCPTGCGCKCTNLTTGNSQPRSNVTGQHPDHLVDQSNSSALPPFERVVDVSVERLSLMREVRFARIAV